jgi:hypothetical protein
MNIGKKAALLTAAAGALIVGGAGGASAYGFGHHLGAQHNKCDTDFVGGAAFAPVAPVIGLPPHSDCVNIGKGAAQSNECDTTFITGLAFAPLAPVKFGQGSQCANIALGDHHRY